MNTNWNRSVLNMLLVVALPGIGLFLVTFLFLATGKTLWAAPQRDAGWPAANAHTIALYHFDGDANDAMGNHHGTLHGNASFAPGYLGQALQLDGEGSYARIGNIHQNPPRSTVQGSVETWVNLADNPIESFAFIVTSNTEYGGNQDHGMYLGKHTAFSENLLFMLWWEGMGWQSADSGIHLDEFVGQWRHLRGTWGPRGLEIWVDGELRGTNPYTGGLPNPNYSTIHIGTNSWQWDVAGLIDEVRIFDIQVLPPAITSADNATFEVDTAGSFMVTTTGAPQPALDVSGTLPDGVSFSDNGDGTATLAGTPAPGAGGVYTLIVTANNGAWPEATQTFALTVNPAAPQAGFHSNSPIALGETAVFTNTSTGDGPLSYEWDFGDGSPIVTGVNPTHVYTAVGNYTVTLTATNAGGGDEYTVTFVVQGVDKPEHRLYLPMVMR